MDSLAHALALEWLENHPGTPAKTPAEVAFVRSQTMQLHDARYAGLAAKGKGEVMGPVFGRKVFDNVLASYPATYNELPMSEHPLTKFPLRLNAITMSKQGSHGSAGRDEVAGQAGSRPVTKGGRRVPRECGCARSSAAPADNPRMTRTADIDAEPATLDAAHELELFSVATLASLTGRTGADVERIIRSHPEMFERVPLGSHRSHQANVPDMPISQCTKRLAFSRTGLCRN
jgi:hypothetical protein